MGPLTNVRKVYRRLRPEQDHWTHFLSILDRRTLEHDATLDAFAKRALCKRNIDLVELEPHAYCNRTCSFCPNATIDRLTVKTHLDHGVYETVLADLASDHPKHAAFAVGNLAKKQSIFVVYAGPEFTAWRRSLATVGEKADPCRTCRQKALEGSELERLGRAVDARLRAVGVDVS